MSTSPVLPQRVLGKGPHALTVPVQGLGCMGLSAFYHSKDAQTEEEKIQFLRTAISLGVNFLDTSDIYGPHTNELLIGKAIQGLDRSKLIIATKFGNRVLEQGQFETRGDKEYVRECVEGSLKRLGIDYIDLYYVHRIDQKVPIEETIEELAEFVKKGKIRHIGLSEAHPNTVRRAHAVYPITAYQLEWSLWSREVEEDLVGVLRELGIGIVAYSPLGRGFLTGSYKTQEDLPQTDRRSQMPRFQGENFAKNLTIVEIIEKIAKERGHTAAQIALAWVQNQGDDVVTIPGTTKLKNLQDNLASLHIKLTPEELKQIADALPPSEGARYPGSGSPYRFDANPPRN